MTKASQKRIDAFIDWFKFSDYVETVTHEHTQQGYGSRIDRYQRCQDAAEHGADGSTYAEVIQDQRDAFENFIDERRRKAHQMSNGERRFGWEGAEWPRFQAAITAYFDQLTAHFEADGTLHRQVG